MKSLTLLEPGKLELRDISVPKPQQGEVLIRVRAATTCGTDLKAWRRGHPQIPMPGPLGHEYSGDVVAVGDEAPFAVGDAIMGVHSAPCLECEWCKKDQENLCESIMATKVLGAYAEYLLIPARIAQRNVFVKPDSLSYDFASLLEPLACVAQGVRELSKSGALQSPANTRVLVIGPGAIGLMFVSAFRQIGVTEVTIAGRNEDRLRVGEMLGAATVAYASLPDRANYDIVVECTGMPEVWERSVELPRRGGTVMWFGGCASGTKVQLDTGRIHYDQISILSPFHFGRDAVRMARQWLIEGAEKFAPIITGSRSLDQATETFQDLAAGRGLKYVFHP